MAQLKEIFGAFLAPNQIINDKDIIAPHLKEWRDRYLGKCNLMLLPQSTQDVQNIVKAANIHELKLCTQGGNTGLVGGQIPQNEVLISMKNMNKIIETRPQDDCMIVEAGVILEIVQNHAYYLERLFPLSLASQGSATIGGLISTNAGGVHVRKYGMMRQLIMGLEVVLPNGEIYSELSPLRKDNTGYDLKQYFIGAEGTLGIITKAVLKLFPKPKYSRMAMIGAEDASDLIEILHHIESECEFLSAFEMMNANALQFGLKNLSNVRNPLDKIYPYLALLEFTSNSFEPSELIENILAKLMEIGLIKDAVISTNEAQMHEFWALREGMSAAQKPEGRAAKHDISVPISKIPQFLEMGEKCAQAIVPNARIAAFGHISDGNIHYDVARPIDMDDWVFQDFLPAINKSIHDLVVSLGGSISAEHGIGIGRRDEFIAREPKPHLDLMRTIKKAFDPNNILNTRILL